MNFNDFYSTPAVMVIAPLTMGNDNDDELDVDINTMQYFSWLYIVVDGEGAKKFLTVRVINAKSLGSAKNIAFSIANSPLIKTAVAGEDPNWGRIIMGIGKSGEMIDSKKLKIKLGNLIVAENGKIADSYNEEKLKQYMQWDSIDIEVNLNTGNGTFTVYTCDFTHDYIDINADYRS